MVEFIFAYAYIRLKEEFVGKIPTPKKIKPNRIERTKVTRISRTDENIV